LENERNKHHVVQKYLEAATRVSGSLHNLCSPDVMRASAGDARIYIDSVFTGYHDVAAAEYLRAAGKPPDAQLDAEEAAQIRARFHVEVSVAPYEHDAVGAFSIAEYDREPVPRELVLLKRLVKMRRNLAAMAEGKLASFVKSSTANGWFIHEWLRQGVSKLRKVARAVCGEAVPWGDAHLWERELSQVLAGVHDGGDVLGYDTTQLLGLLDQLIERAAQHRELLVG
jgi:hypothetical protein